MTALYGPNAGKIVADLANDPTGHYIRTGPGALPNTGRNTLQTPGTNNLDLAIYKHLSFSETMKFRFERSLGTSSTIRITYQEAIRALGWE